MNKYAVGDRVVCIHEYGEGASVGDTGTVVRVREYDEESPIIHWDEYRKCRHDANGIVPDGHGWFIPGTRIQLCKAQDYGEFAPNLAPASMSDLLGGFYEI